MRKIFLGTVVIASAWLVGCGAKQTQAADNNNKETPQTTEKSGSEIYSSKCTACHGADGNMGIAGAKKLPESTLGLEEREAIITNGKGTMPAFKNQLDAASIKVVAEYTLTLK